MPEATETVVATAPDATPPPAPEAAKADTKEPAKEPAKEPPKPPPSAKDWSAVTIAEKRLRAQGERIKAEAAKLEAEKAAIAAERQQASAGMDALRKAYNDGDYSKLEAEFPDLYKRLTQAKLRSGKPAPKADEKPVTKEAILAEIKAEQKAEAEKAKEQQAEAYRIGLENTLVTTVRGALSKYPQLAIEIEDSPDLIRKWLHDMDQRTILNKDGKPFSSMEEAAAEMEARFQARLERRQKALQTLAGQPAPKTETASPRDADGHKSESGGPTTLSSRLSQESALPSSSSGPSAASGDTSPTTLLRLRQEQERRELERATAELVAHRSR